MNMTRKKRFLIVTASAAIITLVAAALFGAFSFTSVCSRCGAIRDTTEWQIPMTSITVFSHSSEHASPVSTVLTSNGIIAAHEHQWLFCQGGGNRVTCAIGEGRHIRPVVQSDGVAVVIAASQRFGDARFRDRLLRSLFDPKTSEAVRRLGMSVPTKGFPDAAAFRAWLSQETESFDEMVAMHQKK